MKGEWINLELIKMSSMDKKGQVENIWNKDIIELIQKRCMIVSLCIGLW